jgi:hypothetical protein
MFSEVEVGSTSGFLGKRGLSLARRNMMSAVCDALQMNTVILYDRN